MSRQSRLQQLLNNPRIWRYDQSGVAGQANLSTGFDELDDCLGGGWPLGTLTELLVDEAGAGELRLLMPALAQLTQRGLSSDPVIGPSGAWVVCIAPPHVLYPPALAQHGVDVSHLLVARPDKPAEILWGVEQSLRSDACGAVLGWLKKTDDRSLRRLQLAAEKGGCLAVIFRHANCVDDPSPAPLRILLSPGETGPRLELLRNRYGRTGSIGVAC